MSSHLTAKNIHFERSSIFSLDDVSIHFPKQKVTSIIGPNGSGKSTFLKVMTRLVNQDRGIVTIDDLDVTNINPKVLARKMTMLSQTHNPDLDLTIGDLVSYGRLPHRRWYEKLTDKDYDTIEWALSITNLHHLRHQSVKQLSGGERQRAWIAMAVVQSPDILLLDEPTTYLDISHQLEIMELVRYLNKNINMTVIMVLHDINQAAKYSDFLVVMQHGRIVKSGAPKNILNKALFRDVFSVHANISEVDGVPAFTPTGIAKKHEPL